MTPTRTCVDYVACPGVDTPVSNLSAEAPDILKYFGYHFFTDRSVFCESTISQELANLCNPPPPTNPPIVVLYSNNAQTCVIDCFGTPISYTVVTGSYLAFSQAEADAAAYAFACELAAIICGGGSVNLVQNTAQSCTAPCSTGGSQTFSIPAGVFSAQTLAQANALAYALACACAAVACAAIPNSTGTGTGSDPGRTPGSGSIWYANSAQTCTDGCEDGEVSYTVPAGYITSTTFLGANAIAYSFACKQIASRGNCLTNIETIICANEVYEDVIYQTGIGLGSEVVWSAVGLPPGLSFNNGIILGTPSSGGNFPTTVTVISMTTGESISRVYDFYVMEITTSSLPNGNEGSLYGQPLTILGTPPGGVIWSIVSGALPPGLQIHPVNGIIEGTPTQASPNPQNSNPFNFVVGVTSSTKTCTKAIGIVIESVFNLIVWDNLIFTPLCTSPGTGHATGNGSVFSLEVHGLPSPPGSDVCTGASALCDGHLNYFNPLPPVFCNLEVVVTAQNPIQYGNTNMSMTVNGVPVVNELAPVSNTYNYPFTLQAGANVITFTFRANVFYANTSDVPPVGFVTMDGRFTQ